MSTISETGASCAVLNVSSLARPTVRVNFLLFVLSLTAAITMATEEASLSQAHSRHQRGLIKLCILISKYTGRPCLNYNNYGCHCGLGSKGGNPVDDVDRCCMIHDKCYGSLKSVCSSRAPHFKLYFLDCNKRECQCADLWIVRKCAYATCQCDLKFAQCLKKVDYNKKNKDFCPVSRFGKSDD